MQVQNIQSQNFQGRAIIVGNYPGSYGSKHLQDAVRQLNTMKVIKNNEFDVFVDDSWWD